MCHTDAVLKDCEQRNYDQYLRSKFKGKNRKCYCLFSFKLYLASAYAAGTPTSTDTSTAPAQIIKLISKTLSHSSRGQYISKVIQCGFEYKQCLEHIHITFKRNNDHPYKWENRKNCIYHKKNRTGNSQHLSKS